jgi:hypothetical protein
MIKFLRRKSGQRKWEEKAERQKGDISTDISVHKKSIKISGAVRRLDVSYQEQSEIFGDNLTPQPQ